MTNLRIKAMELALQLPDNKSTYTPPYSGTVYNSPVTYSKATDILIVDAEKIYQFLNKTSN
jgi:hypothetical protein